MKQIKFAIAIVIILVCAAFFAATPRNVQAAPLQASWSFEDDLETSIIPWSCWTAMPGSSCSTVYASSNTYLVVDAQNGFTNIGRQVNISSYHSNMSCKATMFIKRYAGSAPFTGRVEVIQYNTLNYLSTKTFSHVPLPPFTNWTAITTASWTPPGPDLFIRLVFDNPTTTSKSLGVDLLRVSCTW